MFNAAVRAISDMVEPEQLAWGHLLPPMKNARAVARTVALAVARQAREDGQGLLAPDEILETLVDRAMWIPHYYPYRYRTRYRGSQN
jgi:malate dehydrogenase (oxaloacetate-decarboxylating)